MIRVALGERSTVCKEHGVEDMIRGALGDRSTVRRI